MLAEFTIGMANPKVSSRSNSWQCGRYKLEARLISVLLTKLNLHIAVESVCLPLIAFYDFSAGRSRFCDQTHYMRAPPFSRENKPLTRAIKQRSYLFRQTVKGERLSDQVDAGIEFTLMYHRISGVSGCEQYF